MSDIEVQEIVFKPAEVAVMFRTTPQSINAEIRRGRLHAFRVGRENRITQAALDAYMNRKFVPAKNI